MQVRFKSGLSLMELMAVVAILGILAAIALPRLSTHGVKAKKTACGVNVANIETQVRLWERTKGAWPAANLSDIGASTQFFPGGLPTCPVNNSAYQIDANTHKVTGHSH